MTGADRRRRSRRTRRISRAVWMLALSVAMVGLLLFAVFPTRTYLAQRAATRTALEQLEVLARENAELQERVDMLHSDEEIERLAREQYNLVLPGEEAYALLPAPAPPETAGQDPAGGEVAEGDHAGGGADPAATEDDSPNLLEKAWEALTGWL